MQTRSIFISVLLIVLLPVIALAQIPRIKVDLNATEQPIKLVSLEAEVRIVGFMAQTTMVMQFVNPNRRTLEGELYFPLPESAVLAGYGLDVNGQLIDGVAVEKQKARAVFETEVRKGVDPGLVEKVKGNNFKTRIYPLTPGVARQIKVVFTSENAYRDGETIYRLPLNLSKEIQKFSLRVNVVNSKDQPDMSIEGLQTDKFVERDSGWFTQISGAGQDFSSEVVVKVPCRENELVVVEEAEDGNFYFAVQGVEYRPNSAAVRSKIKSLVILYDASNSGKDRDQELEINFLQKYFRSGQIADQVKVALVPFRNKPGKVARFTVRNGNVQELVRSIKGIDFDGATSFADLQDLNVEPPDCYFLFSDGINTFGKNMLPSFKAPVIALSAAHGSDYVFLRALAGKHVNLKDSNQAVRDVDAQFWGITDKQSSSALSQVVPSAKQQVRDSYSVFGMLAGDSGTLSLAFGSQDKVAKNKEFTISRDSAVKGEFVRKLWAGSLIKELLVARKQNRREIIKLSSKHGIVTEFTSLMVLERVEQYVEHRIIPPVTKPAWRQRYFEIVEGKDAILEQKREKNLENVIAMWERRLQWWKTDFSKASGMPKSIIAPGSAPDRFDNSAIEEDSFGAPRDSLSESASPQRAVRRAPAARLQREGAAMSFKKKADVDSAASRPVNPGVAIKAWKPDAEYVDRISNAQDMFAEYLRQKKEFGNAPSFYLDCSDVFKDSGKAELAIQILSNLAELELENPALLRILAHRLSQWDELEASAAIFSEVLEMRKEEPQSYRDLALVLGRLQKFEKAVELMYEVVLQSWDDRFPEIEVIALEELNNLIVKAKRAGYSDFKVDARLIKPIDLDLRIVMTWDADMTDMDLWVIEPSGEKAYYQNPRTAVGGLVSRDFTRGYGPEEYMIRKARHGMYEIKTNFYGSTAQKVAGAVTLQVDIFTNYGREDEKRRSVTLRLKDKKETFKVADVEF